VPGDLEALMVLRVQGISSAERAACALGVDAEEATVRLKALVGEDLAKERTAPPVGFTLTPAGLETLDELLVSEALKGDEQLCACYELFMRLNKRVLKLSSDWQVRRERGVEVPNDHSDPAYDYAVIERLIGLHDRARACISKIAECSPRFAAYVGRLESCAERLERGDTAAFTAPLAESYHTVWFELHQDLLLTLGLKREE
jgi:pyruvate,orthophosphate dikinase